MHFCFKISLTILKGGKYEKINTYFPIHPTLILISIIQIMFYDILNKNLRHTTFRSMSLLSKNCSTEGSVAVTEA